MTKHDFLLNLVKRLSFLNKDEASKIYDFYNELIDDKIENGMSEFEACESVGTIDEIVDEVRRNTQNGRVASGEKAKEKQAKQGETISATAEKTQTFSGGARHGDRFALAVVILVVTAFIWVPVLGGLAAVLLGLVAGFFLVGIVFLVLVLVSFILVCFSPYFFVTGGAPMGIAALGLGFFMFGFSILLSILFFYASKFMIIGLKKFFPWCSKQVKRFWNFLNGNGGETNE